MRYDLTSLVQEQPASFRTSERVRDDLRDACSRHPSKATMETIGISEEGRPVDGIILGRGPRRVSLIAGNHADEPVGPETLRRLVSGILRDPDAGASILEMFTLYIVPHTNPDGEARNWPWIRDWPDLPSYLRHVSRALPGRDLEFGFPEMRPENEHVTSFLRPHAPFHLHASLHGMSVSEGAMLLINRPWAFRTEELQSGYRTAAAAAGLRMHDHNRKGEKGFFWIAPGFQTTPRGDAMRSYFRSIGDDAMADRFHDSSMEMVMGWGGDPLCIVTELPLWVLSGTSNPTDSASPPHRPERYLAFRERFADLRHQDLTEQLNADSDSSIVRQWLDGITLEPLDPATAMHLQLTALSLALDTVADYA